MKKKLIAVFLVVATLLSCVFAFVACDDRNTPDNEDKNNSQQNPNEDDENIFEVETVLQKLATYAGAVPNEYRNQYNIGVYSNIDFGEVEYEGDGYIYEYSIMLHVGFDESIKFISYKTKEEALLAVDNIGNDYDFFGKTYGYCKMLTDNIVVLATSEKLYDDIMGADISKCIYPTFLLDNLIFYAKTIISEKIGGMIFGNWGSRGGEMHLRYGDTTDLDLLLIDSYYLLDNPTEEAVERFNYIVEHVKNGVFDGYDVSVIKTRENYIKFLYIKK